MNVWRRTETGEAPRRPGATTEHTGPAITAAAANSEERAVQIRNIQERVERIRSAQKQTRCVIVRRLRADSVREQRERRLVPEEGVEPSLPEGNGILSPARLPVSPLRPEGNAQYTATRASFEQVQGKW